MFNCHSPVYYKFLNNISFGGGGTTDKTIKHIVRVNIVGNNKRFFLYLLLKV